MPDDSYVLAMPAALVSHYRTATWPWLLRDQDEPNIELDAHVRSGDYFITLVTTLESIRDELPASDEPARIALDKLIKDLEYIERRYALTKIVS